MDSLWEYSSQSKSLLLCFSLFLWSVCNNLLYCLCLGVCFCYLLLSLHTWKNTLSYLRFPAWFGEWTVCSLWCSCLHTTVFPHLNARRLFLIKHLVPNMTGLELPTFQFLQPQSKRLSYFYCPGPHSHKSGFIKMGRHSVYLERVFQWGNTILLSLTDDKNPVQYCCYLLVCSISFKIFDLLQKYTNYASMGGAPEA